MQGSNFIRALISGDGSRNFFFIVESFYHILKNWKNGRVLCLLSLSAASSLNTCHANGPFVSFSSFDCREYHHTFSVQYKSKKGVSFGNLFGKKRLLPDCLSSSTSFPFPFAVYLSLSLFSVCHRYVIQLMPSMTQTEFCFCVPDVDRGSVRQMNIRWSSSTNCALLFLLYCAIMLCTAALLYNTASILSIL